MNVRFQRPGTIEPSGQLELPRRGCSSTGCATPQSDAGLELTNVAQVLAGQLDPANDRENGLRRQTDISVDPERHVRGAAADEAGAAARIRRPARRRGRRRRGAAAVDAGRDVNGNGEVDFRTAGSTEYGFERFVTKSSPLIGNHDVNAPRGDGEFRPGASTRRGSKRASTSSPPAPTAIAPTAGRPCSATSGKSSMSTAALRCRLSTTSSGFRQAVGCRDPDSIDRRDRRPCARVCRAGSDGDRSADRRDGDRGERAVRPHRSGAVQGHGTGERKRSARADDCHDRADRHPEHSTGQCSRPLSGKHPTIR